MRVGKSQQTVAKLKSISPFEHMRLNSTDVVKHSAQKYSHIGSSNYLFRRNTGDCYISVVSMCTVGVAKPEVSKLAHAYNCYWYLYQSLYVLQEME